MRSPEYLHWRYQRHPYVKYEFFACYRGGNLQGYSVFSLAEGRAQIVDVFGHMDQPDLMAMLRCLMSLLRSRKVSVVSMEILDTIRGWRRSMAWDFVTAARARSSTPTRSLVRADRGCC